MKLKSWLSPLLILSVMGSFVACQPENPDPAVTTPAGAVTTPTGEDEKQPYVYKHVVIVGVDGAGAFFREADTPNLDEIFANGAVTYEAITSTPSISAECWGSMLHGVTPEFHRLTNGITAVQAYPQDSEFPSVFRVIREQMPDASLASFCNFSNINIGIIEDGIGVHKWNNTKDLQIIKKASKYVEKAVENGEGAPTLMLLHLDEADAAGHGSGYGTETHLKKIAEQDGWIRQLYDTYAKLGLLEDTLFIVTTDHGGKGNSHGGDSDTEMKIMFAAAGKTVEKGVIGEMGVRDTAAIVLHALGLKQPASWTARVPSGVFKGVTAGEWPVYVVPEGNRAHENVATPEKGSEGYITNFIKDKKLLTYWTFDGDITDECGAATTQGGKLYFVEGYFGQGVSLDDGYVSIPDYAPGTDSFTVSLWLNTKGVVSDPAIFSNKNWSDGRLEGYVFSMNSAGNVKFNAGNGADRVDVEERLPYDYATGWVHVTLVVDRAAGEIKIALDFGRFTTMPLPDALKNATFNAYDVLNIGQDGTGSYGADLTATVDEFMIFDGTLTAEELKALAAYYGK